MARQRSTPPMSERVSGRGTQAWVGALMAGDEENWQVCVDKGLWGTGSNNGKSVRRGDEFFVWRSKSGWLARCVVTSDAIQPNRQNPAPWDDDRDYKWIFGIRVLRQLDAPYNPGSTDNVQNITMLHNIRLGQFPKLTIEQEMAVRSFFGLVNPPTTFEDELVEQEDNAHEQEILQRNLDGPVERLQLVKARRGQGVFRDNVLLVETFCRVTGLRVADHLRASHIKPWAKSDDQEKIDGDNGLLLSPHVDHLFDRGWIRFEADGMMVPSQRLDPAVLASWRIEPVWEKQPFNETQQMYLHYHEEFVFKS